MTGSSREPQRWQTLTTGVSSVAAPITLLTALLVYTAWTRTKTFFDFFGVDSSILELSIQDYLLRSADTVFGILAWICVGLVTVLVTTRVTSQLIGMLEASRRRYILTAAAWLALACVLIGLVAAIWPPLSRLLTPYGASGILVGGALLMSRTQGALGFIRGTVSDDLIRAITVVVMAVACFWAATVYARDLGTREAVDIDENPASLAEVDLYSAKPLDMPGSLVTGTDVSVTPSELSYRYVGLRLLEFSNDRWLLVTGRRPGLHPSILILKDSDEIRVQIASVS